MMLRRCLPACIALLLLPVAAAPAATPSYPEQVHNTESGQPLSPAEALDRMELPDGFEVTLFAAEPQVAQPIDFTFDDRGRLWVAECYSYPDPGDPWDREVRDRILIFEDTDRDGRFDSRKVFWDGAKNLTSIALGFGGVWACMTPELVFIPDRDGDDQPDGPPRVLLDGWNDQGIGHNVFNNLRWGPDGWLYGAQGLQATSHVGKPGTGDDQRRAFNGGIWRYHPTRDVFEVVAEGTTNPWGLDWNDYGQAFFTNCVIGHLWHLIPGAHYERMYGDDFTPHKYDVIDQHADHLHWVGDDWTASREHAPPTDRAGGGHAHVGAMVYLGDNWPDRYRDTLFTHNLHGLRINNDILERRGSGYVGRHGDDFLFANDEWYRPVRIRYGPDGGVFICDWNDKGECHEADGIYATSGRIYKITHGTPENPGEFDLRDRSSAELVELQLEKNDWWVRHARRILQERAAGGEDMATAHERLRGILADHEDVTRKLRALWALKVTGGLGRSELIELLDHDSEHVRSWALRFLCEEKEPPQAAVAKFADMAEREDSALVRLFLAAMLQRMPTDDRWAIAEGLMSHGVDADDHNIPLMIWYGFEPLVAEAPRRALDLAKTSEIPLLTEHIIRRIAAIE